MRIYILADMEGIVGIRRPEMVDRAQADYAVGCNLMIRDVNAAIAGAIEGGATQIVVCDTHGNGGQLRLAEMDRRAQYENPSVARMMPALDETFDGLILLGHHARAGTMDGFLDHTMNSAAWFEYRINDQVVGEIGIEAAWAGHYHVPVIMVEGDQATSREARALLGDDLPCAVVKWGLGRNRARCLSVEDGLELVRTTAAQAVRSAKSRKPFRPALPGTIQLTFYRSDMADDLAAKIGTRRLDARTLQRDIASLLDVCRW